MLDYVCSTFVLVAIPAPEGGTQMPRRRTIGLILAGSLIVGTSAASGSETITYTYDAKGRLVKVVHTGTVNNGVTTQYAHDHADNRTNVKVTGAP
jgi:YD repeat-containing protein